MSEPKKSIDNYVKGELMIGFEKNVSRAFAQEFIKILGYEVLGDSRCKKYKRMLIKVSEGQEYETIDALKKYKKIIRFAKLKCIAKGVGKNQSSQQKTLECKVCYAEIKKGDIYVEAHGVKGCVCLRCDSIAMEEAIYERNIASLDEV